MNTDYNKFLEKLTEGDRAAVKRAYVSRGKRKGAMKASAPSAVKDTQAWAAWQAIKSVSTHGATHTESVTFTLIMFPEARATWDRVTDAALEIAKEIQSKG